MAKIAVLVATGPSLAVLLARRAEARVCGQSGITPKCPTFDCDGDDDVWGWCWYASPGCCANGGLKKICDCCTVNWPNVHGYCPSGTNVRCIMESCYADPRVLAANISPLAGTDPVENAIARLPADVTAIFVGGEHLAVTAPLARVRELPILASSGDRLDPRLIRAIQRQRITSAVVVAGDLSVGARAELARYVTVDTIDPGGDPSTDIGSWSAGVAGAVRAAGGDSRIVATADSSYGASGAVAASLAATFGLGLVVGESGVAAAHAAISPRVTWFVGGGWDRSVLSNFAGAKLVGASGTPDGLRDAAEALMSVEAQSAVALLMMPTSAGPELLRQAVAVDGVIVLHTDPETEPTVRQFVRTVQPLLGDATYVPGSGGLVSEGVWQMQSAMNHYDTHQLIGVSGQGLPVISQPRSERPIGAARVLSYPLDDLPEEQPPYWMSRADPGRADR